jgi:carboxypeptidase C (cathepsin A)
MRVVRFALVLAMLAGLPMFGQQTPTPAPKPPDAAKPEPPPEPVKFVSKHHLQSGGTDISYTATAEEIYLKDGAGKPAASFFTTSYIKDGVARPEDRPVTFVFNGGPGSASVWLHFGLVGPKLIDIPSDAADPACHRHRLRRSRRHGLQQGPRRKEG